MTDRERIVELESALADAQRQAGRTFEQVDVEIREAYQAMQERIAELETQLAAVTRERDELRANHGPLTREWRPCSIPGYEQRINEQGYLETRPLDATRE